jgi:UPF0176 protein
MDIYHIAFYRFVPLADAQGVVNIVRELAAALMGAVLIAPEGINGTLAGSAAQLDEFERALAADPRLAKLFSGMRFQRTKCLTAPFQRLKVHLKAEIVQIGVDDVDPNALPAGINVSPQDWDALIAREDVVLIDNRNHFEFELGRFSGALDPGVSRYQDFARFMSENLPLWQAQGKQIAMYCTGGIRCEKTSAWLATQKVSAFQLDGGILNYLRVKDGAASAWDGACFVFDNRMALDKNLCEQEFAPEAVYNTPEDAWRLARAQRLAASPDATAPGK